MKRVIYLVILSIIIYSCQKLELLDRSNPLDDGRPFVATIKSDFITSTTAELYGEVISTGETPITLFGHCWSTSNTPTIENMYQGNDNYNSNKYVIPITELTPSTKYYFRAFATNSIETAYGEELSFTTNDAGEPLVITEGISNITSTSVTLLGQIEDIGYAPVTEHGHCWSISSSPSITINDGKTSLGSIGVTTFNSNASDLAQNTTYYYRAYATNSFGTVYGSAMNFSTTNGEPTVVTAGSSNVTASTVDLEGNITGIGDAPVTEHGHCWSISSSPTINDSKTSLGSIGVASFVSVASDLTHNTTYYYRAYATNSFGTVYGSEINFTTIGLWSNIGQLSGITYNNNAMLVLSSNNVWIVGDDVWNWDGSNWNSIGSPSNFNLTAVHGTSSNNIWVVDNDNVFSSEVWKWNGSSWTSYPGASTGISNVQDILVFGNSIVIGGTQNFGPGIKISTNSGSSWSLEYPTCSSNCQGFSDMDGNSNNNIWVGAGSFSNNGVQGTVIYNGVSWSSNENMYNIQCLSVLNSNSAFATSAPNSGSWYPTIWEYNGGWNSISLPAGMDMNWGYTPVDAVQSNAIWFGSDKIYKYNGSDWAEETGTIGSEIQMIRMLNANEGYAVTGNGTILKR
jgi:hypothetical protein